MIGAVIGDILGSRYEGSFARDIVAGHDWWSGLCTYTDDTVMTAAVARWLLDGGDVGDHLHELGRRHLGRGYGINFYTWLIDMPRPPAYGSWGNGSAMRVSPVALWGHDEAEVRELARASALPTHNHPQGIRGAEVAALAMHRAYTLRDPDLWAQSIEQEFPAYTLAALDAEKVRQRGMELECETTVHSALWCAHQGGSFEGMLAHVLSLGGDTDTLAAIAGPMAEGLYGVPEAWIHQAAGYFRQGEGVWEVFQRFYQHPRVQARYARWHRPVPMLPDLPERPAPPVRPPEDNPFTRYWAKKRAAAS
jgi:ADP-ribosylglycohydrolase